MCKNKNLYIVYAHYRSIIRGRLKSFEPQHEDGITRQNHSGNTIAHALRDTCRNYSHFGSSVVV